MRIVCSFLLLFQLSFFASSQVKRLPDPSVDNRIELLSLVFRLAGNQEYNTEDNKGYVQKIHAHFDRYQNHPLIRYAKSLHESSGIGYDAVMAMAVSLSPVPGLEPIVPFSVRTPESRWKEGDAAKFCELLKQFYRDAACDKFFAACSKDYQLAAKQFAPVFNQLDLGWYYSYYGKAPNEEFNIVIGLANGGNNYGPHVTLPDGIKKVYAVIGASSFDSTGVPTFTSADYLPTLIHEFNHSFVNELTDKYEKELAASGETIFNEEKVKMQRQAYATWKTMSSEALVRASVIRYLMRHKPDSLVADRELKGELARGFVWMKELVATLGRYEQQRKVYPTLESFMPELVRFYDTVAPKIQGYDEAYLAHCARLVSVTPFSAGDSAINASTTELHFTFDKPLDGRRYFFGPTKKGMEHYPKPVGFLFTNDNKTLVMKVELKPATDYEINMMGRLMRTADGYAVQDRVLHFKTN